MTFAQATIRLTASQKHELRDYVFNDAEVTWEDASGETIAYGYFGMDGNVVSIEGQTWRGPLAALLRKCGRVGRVERNDEYPEE